MIYSSLSAPRSYVDDLARSTIRDSEEENIIEAGKTATLIYNMLLARKNIQFVLEVCSPCLLPSLAKKV